MPIDDGMPDLGNLPSRIKAVRNKITKIVVTRESLGNYQLGENEEDPWVRHVRFAYAHQDELELLQYDPATEEDPLKAKVAFDREDGSSEPSVPTLKSGDVMTQAALDGMAYQSFRALAKSYKVKVDGRTRLAITEDLLKAAYTEAGLEPPANLAPKE